MSRRVLTPSAPTKLDRTLADLLAALHRTSAPVETVAGSDQPANAGGGVLAASNCVPSGITNGWSGTPIGPSFVPGGFPGGSFPTAVPGSWGPGAASSGTSWIPYPPLPAAGTSEHERMLDVLEDAAGPVRGRALTALARWLADTGRVHDLLDGAELAVDLIGVESDQACEALAVLIADGWEHSLGDLLACARTL